MAEAALLNQGWHLSKEGLERCKDGLSDPRAESIVRKALDIDLRHIGLETIHADVAKGKVDKIQGPLVLQVQKIRNISAPKANEDSGAAPPLLRLQLTDGHTTVMALVLSSIAKVGLSTPPGSKLKLNGSVTYIHGFLLLMTNNCSVLGGNVEELVQRWQLAKSLYHHTRAAVTGAGGPPPWVPFGQRDRHGDASLKPAKITMKKSLEDPKPKEQTEQDKDFVEQRKAAIQEVNKNKQGQGKTFGGTKTTTATQSRDGREPARKDFENNRRDSGRNSRRGQQVEEEAAAGKPRSEGIYRDLDYGGYQPNERDIQQLVSMGFKRDAASNALRKHAGKADAAVEMLLKESGSSEPQQQAFGRQRPDTRPERGRGNERRGRRGEDEEEGTAPPAAPATLFDFLQPKLGKDKEKGSQSSVGSGAGKDMGRQRDFSKEQPNSIREAGISFVHDEGRTSNYRQLDQQQGRQQRNDMRQNRRNYDQSGSGRSDNNSMRKYTENYDRGRNQDHNYGNKENSNFRDRNSYQDRRDDSRRDDSRRDDSRRDDSRRDDSRRDDSRRDDSRRDDSRRDDSRRDNSYPQRRENTRGEERQYNDSRGKYANRGNQRDSGYRNQEKPGRNADYKPKDYQDSRPPRFQKQSDSQMKNPQQRIELRSDGPKKNWDSEGNRQGGSQFQPPRTSNIDSASRQMQPTPNLNPGDHCQAKYWEDQQFYNAILTAIHPSGKTCVVLFPDYGNHEEVKMTDVRPAPSQAWFEMNSSKVPPPGPVGPSFLMSDKGGMFEGSTSAHLEFRQGGEGTVYNRPRQQREPQRNVKPAQSFYQPPSSRK